MSGVRIEATGGVITRVRTGIDARSDDVRLTGLVLPGFANAHSHAFHRALRGRTHDQGGTFWTWRERMYAVAGRLDPDSYLALARATYAEMALAGISRVGEFHYLHHGPGGVPYDDPNEMGLALIQAAGDAGVRLTLLDTCYLAGGLTADGHTRMDGVQRRFGDVDAQGWAARVDGLRAASGGEARGTVARDTVVEDTVIGAAVHSVRAVPREQLAAVRVWRESVDDTMPLHVHLSEQPAENEACQRFYGMTPAALLDSAGLLGAATTVVHATHLTGADIALLGRSRTTACFCPTTERDLADGIGPARALFDAGTPLSLGSDQHSVIDLLEEARGLESHERLTTLQRGCFTPAELTTVLTSAGHVCLGRPDDGRIAVGSSADLVELRPGSPRTAGTRAGQVIYAATASDIRTVVIGGRTIVQGGVHRLGDVGAMLVEAIEPLWREL